MFLTHEEYVERIAIRAQDYQSEIIDSLDEVVEGTGLAEGHEVPEATQVKCSYENCKVSHSHP